MTLDQALRIAQVIAIFASGLLNVYLFFKTRNTTQMREHRGQISRLEKDRRDGDAKLHQRIETISGEHKALGSDLVRRVSIVENTISHMPTHRDLTGIRDELSDLNGNVEALGERSKSNNEMLQSIQKHLMGVE